MKKLTTLALCIIMVFMSVISAAALELDVAENAAEDIPATESAALSADETLDIPLIDEKYGKLILYKNFEQENAAAESYAYMDTSYMTATGTGYASASGAIVDNPAEGGSGKVWAVTGSGWVQSFVTFSDLYVQPGEYMTVYDYYSESACGDFMERYFTNIRHSGGSGAGDYLSISPSKDTFNTGAWITKPYTVLKAESLTDDTGTGFTVTYDSKTKPYYNTETNSLKINNIGIMPSASSMTYYLDNIKLYHFPANAVIYKNGDALKMVEYDADTITLPVLSEVDETWTMENFKVWTDGTDFYIPGKSYDVAEVGCKTLTPVAFANELYDETKGDLVLLLDYEGTTSPTDYTYVNSEYFADVTEMPYIRYDGLCTFSVVTDEDGNNVVSVKTVKKGINLFGYLWKGNIAAAADLVTADFDYKIVNDISAFSGKTFWIRMCGENGGESYVQSGYVNYTTEVDTWTDVVVSKTYDKYTGTMGMLPQWGLNAAYDSEMYIDNFAVYVKPAVVTFSETADSEVLDSVEFIGSATELTFPNPEDLGLPTENFVCWTNGDEYYKAGETIAFTNASHPANTSFYAFYQASDVPAVISLYEGEEQKGVSKTSYVECIDDDGRNVLHAHQWKTTWTESNQKYMGDARVSLKHTGFDASEYDVIEIMTKSPAAYNAVTITDKDTDYTVKTETGIALYNFINSSYSYNANSLIGTFSYPVDNEYHLIKVDMKTRTNETYPWETTGFGFAYDINTSTFGADTYVDYVRVYRSGVTTVNYDTNAPENATVVSEVAPDTGRGLGTGYLLKDLRPEVEGYVFKGWAKSADSTETVTSIDLTGDATVYAVWEAAEGYVSPEMLAETEIRGTGTNNGIRFKSVIMPSVKENLDEFGFIATREILLPVVDAAAGVYDHESLTFTYKAKGENTNYYVQGIAYDKATGIDIINSELDDGSTVYTTVLSGIPLANANENMIVRPYAKYEINGHEMTVYGTSASGSLYETAKSIKEEAGEAYLNNKTYIDSIVPDAE